MTLIDVMAMLQDICDFEDQRGEFMSTRPRSDNQKIDPDHPLALNNTAYLYAEHLNDPAKAEPYAKHAADVQRNDPETLPFILDTLGWVQFKLKKLEDAEDSLRQSIELTPSADNHLHLAFVLYETGRYDKAMLYLRRAGELQPSPDIQSQLNQLLDDLNRKTRP